MDALNQIFDRFPSLIDCLHEEEWTSFFREQVLERSKIYSFGSRIKSLRMRETAFKIGKIEAEVEETVTVLYGVTIFFEERDDRMYLEPGNCTCPVGVECKHSAAVLKYLQKRSKIYAKATGKLPSHALDWQTEEWLKRLEQGVVKTAEAVAEKETVYGKFLAFCLEKMVLEDQPPVLTLRIGTRLKGGGVSLDKSYAAADIMNPPKYMSEDDLPLVIRYRQLQKADDSYYGLSVEGDGPASLVRNVMENGRLFFYKGGRNMPNLMTVPVSEGEPVSVRAAWAHQYDGTLKPELRFSKNGLSFIAADPAMYVDFRENVIGELESDLPGNLLRIWTQGPHVAKNSTAPVAKKLRALPTVSGKKIPGPVELKEEAGEDVDPTAKLWIGRLQTRTGKIIAAVPTFRYGSSSEIPAKATEGVTGYYSEIVGQKYITWRRRLDLESELYNSLLENGFAKADRSFISKKSGEDLNHALVLRDQMNEDIFPWLEFLDSPVADELRDKGWQLEVDPNQGLQLHELDELFPDLVEEPNHGIEWFRFDISGQVEGKNISMIPHIAEAIREGILEASPYSKEREEGLWSATCHTEVFLPEYMLISCENPSDGYIKFPSGRFQEICKQVAHLFQGDEATGPLRVDRLGAADIAGTLNIDTSATTRSLAKLGRELKNIDSLPVANVPAGLNAELREYQREGFSWLQFLAQHGLHGILADDMGLGKTLQTLCHLSAEAAKNPGRPSLVIAPTSVVPNWVAEAEKFTPGMRILMLHGSDRGEHFENIAKVDLVVTSYPLLTRDIGILEEQDWHVIVLDEAQYIKNPKAIVAKNACKLKSAHRVCLSGTPMENHLGELWSLMRFLMPGLLKDEKTFNKHFRKPIEKDRSMDAQRALNRRISPLILRRTKDQVATELPEKTEIVHHIDLTKKQTDLYESVRASMDKRVRDAISAKGLGQSHIIVLDALLKLRQICCHPQLLKTPAAQNIKESAKLDFLTKDLLPTLLEEGRRTLVFSQFTSMLSMIEEHLVKEGIPYLKLTGQTKDRGALVEKFQTGDVPVFLISLKAGGTGLNLTAADTVIHYDPWWNPSAESQATDRAHRIGQTKPVFVHKLACTGTIEDRILELQKKKSALVEALLSTETANLKLDSETLSHLLSPLD
ncbi:SNF2-related protein [Luteolibacter sp. AS25]|uniref:DEAD/DEAH box helicase n=1 Tax=Luteolibacter sp. AS25 TaxID=3135776 RepID=UPI00398B7107